MFYSASSFWLHVFVAQVSWTRKRSVPTSSLVSSQRRRARSPWNIPASKTGIKRVTPGILKPNDPDRFFPFLSHQSAIMPDITFYRFLVRQPVTYSIEKTLLLALGETFADTGMPMEYTGVERPGVARGRKIIFHVGQCEINNVQTRFDFPEVPVGPRPAASLEEKRKGLRQLGCWTHSGEETIGRWLITVSPQDGRGLATRAWLIFPRRNESAINTVAVLNSGP